MPERTSADEALTSKLWIRRQVEGKLPETEVNSEIARNVLHEELGYIGERRPAYALDEDTRDILIVHCRQDAAHALLNTIALLNRQKQQQRISLLILAAVVYIAIAVSV